MRKGRYRYQMIPKEHLEVWAKPLEEIFAQWLVWHQRGQLAEWEFATFYLLIFVFLERPEESWSYSKTRVNFSRAHSRELIDELNWGVVTCLKNYNLHSNPDLWLKCSSWAYGDMMQLRGVPEKVLWSLRHWRLGSYALALMHRVPSSMELLKMQVQGQRCVTALINAREIRTPVEQGRDVWSFCLHDLSHASHFFARQSESLAQRYLSWFFLRAWTDSSLAKAISSDSILEKQFSYVAADMNAHPVYLFYSFYAIVLGYFKRSLGYSERQNLLATDELAWKFFWRDLLRELVPSSEMANDLSILAQGLDQQVAHAHIDRVLRTLGEELFSQLEIPSLF